MLNYYFLGKYHVSDLNLTKIELQSNINKNDLVIYALPERETEYDFSHPFKPIEENNKLVFSVNSKIRAFRIYIGKKTDRGIFDQITLFHNGKSRVLALKEFKNEGIRIASKTGTGVSFSSELNGYFEIKKSNIRIINFFHGFFYRITSRTPAYNQIFCVGFPKKFRRYYFINYQI